MTAASLPPGAGALAAGARRLTDLATEVRRQAAAVAAAAAAVGWRSTAAGACRARLADLGLDLLGVAALLEHAAAVVDDHACTAAHRAATLEHGAAGLVLAGTRGLVGRVLG